MKLPIEFAESVGAPRFRRTTHLLDDLIQRTQLEVVAHVANETCRRTFQDRSHEHHVDELSLARKAHDGTTMWSYVDEAFLRELAQRFTDGSATGLHLVCNARLCEPRAGRQCAGTDRLAKTFGDLRSQRCPHRRLERRALRALSGLPTVDNYHRPSL